MTWLDIQSNCDLMYYDILIAVGIIYSVQIKQAFMRVAMRCVETIKKL
jgi:hypothetical protein